MDYHELEAEAALERLGSDRERGLGSAAAAGRLERDGPNELAEKGGRSPLRILWEQLTATMVLILVAAALAAALLGDAKNAVAVSSIVVLYAVLGFVQEYRAERAIAALKKMAVPTVRALRDGTLVELSARELVAGDLVRLETGNLLPADGRILEAVNLSVTEAALTGESEPVEKRTEALRGADLPLGDRRNMAYMGTVVAQGRGTILVTATGMRTELGRIADLIQKVPQEATPLQKRLDRLGKILAGIGVLVAGLVFAIGVARGDDLRHMLLTAVSVAVAIVPEGLPAVVTITLALGAQRMLARRALVRRLTAVETLGSVTTICSDKTGTLTENKMTVVALDVAGRSVDLSEETGRDGGARIGDLPRGPGSGAAAAALDGLGLLALGGALCNDARLAERGGGGYHAIGDPTEGALVVAAAKLGFWKDGLDAELPRVAELPFDSDRKRMSTVHRCPADLAARLAPAAEGPGRPGAERLLVAAKGSVDGLLEVSSRVWTDAGPEPLDRVWKERIEATNARLAGRGMRVLGVALRLVDEVPVPEDTERGLCFVGLFGMIDPPRPEVRDAVALAQAAGIRTVMITGDHPLTAAEIGRQLGILRGGAVLTGAELERLDDAALRERVEGAEVFARVSPEHKIRIVRALQERGHIVSMTGDGVNDAPALRRADIGVAMGLAGTDVSKEAAALVLLDDNFSTIVAAVREGRTIYDNIRKFVAFSVAGNLGKVLVMLLAPFLGKPIPLLPLQLLWLNLLTDGLLGLGMGVEQAEREVMSRPPYSPKEGVFSRGAASRTIRVGLLIGALGLGVGWLYFSAGRPEWQTMIFASLAFAQVGQALGSRSARDSALRTGFSGNPLLAGSAALVVLLQLAVVYLPPLADFFGVLPLPAPDLAVAAASALVVLGALELEKLRASSRARRA